MTKKTDREKQPPPVEVTEQTFKRLVERLLNTPPKHKTSPKPKKRKH